MVEGNAFLDNFTGSFNEWLHSICVITFDLELGQTIEVIFHDLVYFLRIKHL